MSDCFDHAGDAAFDLFEGRTWTDGRSWEPHITLKKTPKDITCKHCNLFGLNWIFYEGRWRLYDPFNEELHVCDPVKVKSLAAYRNRIVADREKNK